MVTVNKVLINRVNSWLQEQVGMSASYCNELGIQPQQRVIIKFGRWIKEFPIVQVESGVRKQLFLPAKIIKEIGLSHGQELRAFYHKETNHFFIGPLIGVFASSRITKNGVSFGEQGLFFRELATASKRAAALMYLFSAKDINWGRGSIQGYVHLPGPGKGKWVRGSFPFPDAIYDRIISWHLSKENYEAKIRLRRINGMNMFNPTMGDKWQFHELLASDEAIISYLPETKNLTTTTQLAEWIKYYPHTYIKPRLGSQGKGIVKLSRLGKSGYLFQLVQAGGKITKIVFPTIGQLGKIINNMIRQRKYLIQQGLALATWQGSVFDIRVLTQKNGQGKWVVTGMVCRIGRKGSVVSNVHGGGKAMDVITVLKDLFGKYPGMVSRVINEVRRLSLNVSSRVESFHGLVGELGIDVGVDETGQVWLIEVNPKPGRSVFRKVGDYAARQKAVENPVKYITYLTGFGFRET